VDVEGSELLFEVEAPDCFVARMEVAGLVGGGAGTALTRLEVRRPGPGEPPDDALTRAIACEVFMASFVRVLGCEAGFGRGVGGDVDGTRGTERGSRGTAVGMGCARRVASGRSDDEGKESWPQRGPEVGVMERLQRLFVAPAAMRMERKGGGGFAARRSGGTRRVYGWR